MKRSFLVIDDFLDNYWEVYEKALNRRYDTITNPLGTPYGHAAKDDGDFPWDKVRDAMSFGNEEYAITPLLSMFKSVNAEQGMADDRWIHNDLSKLGTEWSCIISLNDVAAVDMTGTACFQHNKVGCWEKPDSDKLAAAGLNPNVVTRTLVEDTFKEDEWTLTEFAAMVPNRAVIFPAARWHARYPRESWGDIPSNGRLIWFGFFKEAK